GLGDLIEDAFTSRGITTQGSNSSLRNRCTLPPRATAADASTTAQHPRGRWPAAPPHPESCSFGRAVDRGHGEVAEEIRNAERGPAIGA
ncbi:MAG: hypothetical protein ACRDZO_28645, partial [Egibacteraceae bacterium]